MKILSFTTLFPSSSRPAHGIFVENRLRHLRKDHGVEMRIVAPVPWFPFRGARFGEYGKFAATPRQEERHGVRVTYPRYPLIPKVGMNSAPDLMAWATLPHIRRIIAEEGDFDLIDAHYFYPDGVAAAQIARALNKPLTITARGTDINLIPEYPVPKRKILATAAFADGMITVCEALRTRLIELGADEDKVQTMRNGVDLDMFRPADRDQVREDMELSGPTILSVGHLIERKGHYLIIDALKDIPDVTLLIAGTGPDKSALEAQVAKLNLGDRVRFLGQIAHEKLNEVYSSADVLILASGREGWPNVLLEAMACGTPVVATKVWGSGEVVREPAAGRLSPERSAQSLARETSLLLSNLPARSETRHYAEQFSWKETSDAQFALFSRILDARSGG